MYSIRLELGRELDERLFVEYQKSLAAKEENEARNRRKFAWYVKRIAFVCVFLGFFIGLIVMSIADVKAYRKLQDVREEIRRRPVLSEAHPVIDASYREELEKQIAIQEELLEKAASYNAIDADELKDLGEEVLSQFAIVVDVNSNTVVASREGRTRIVPASMTKILTVLVAAEHIMDEAQLDEEFTVTPEITYYAYRNGCSAVGFSDNEVVRVKDLFYGTILPSGGDAAVALAEYIAGSQEEFVDLMNQKLEDMGLDKSSHFTNCVGLYSEDHYSTCYDLAMILHAAIDNPLCKEILSQHHYVTTSTPEHPDGIEMSNWFLRRIEDKPCGGEVVCAKTGYVSQSGNCAASYASDGNGNDFICVTGNAPGSWKCIYDHVRTYRQFFPDYDSSMADAAKEADEAENGAEENN